MSALLDFYLECNSQETPQKVFREKWCSKCCNPGCVRSEMKVDPVMVRRKGAA